MEETNTCPSDCENYSQYLLINTLTSIAISQKRQADALEGILDFLTNAGVHKESGRCTLSEARRDTVFRVNER